MQIKIFSIPILESEAENTKLNTFLRGNKVVEIVKQLTVEADMNYWTFCIKYMDGEVPARNLKYPEKIDYRTVLSEIEFKRFAALREIRKIIAQKEALPAFAIFTDAELSEMAKIENLSMETLSKINGIGEKKLEKYGIKFVIQ